MTDQIPTPQPPAPEKGKSWFARHKIMSTLGALVLVIIVISATSSNGSTSSNTEDTSATASSSTSNDTGVTDTADTSADESSSDAAPAEHAMKVKAKKIIREFENNEAAADVKYKGKTLRVTGVVAKVDTDMWDDSKYSIELNSGKQWDILTVSCNYVSEAVAAKVHKGSTVAVVGAFDDGGDLGVTLKDCTLAK